MLKGEKIKIGVMASADLETAARLAPVIDDLGAEIARHDLLLLTGATTGVPDAVARAARSHGVFTIGISPAQNADEHATRYRLPSDTSDALIFTGFGLKGRNVVLVRSADIVLVIAGGMGTLNEFTIAVDEGKVVGVLTGTGGIADEIERLLGHVRDAGRVFLDPQPARLLDLCLSAYCATA
jgi:uncharacterized protein (TIGR00725 family)